MKFNVENFIKNLLKMKNAKGELVITREARDHIYKDFDDIIPFLLYFDLDQEIREQILLSKKYVNQGFIEYNSYLYSWRMDEYLGGLIFYYLHTGDKDVFSTIKIQEEFLNKLFKLNYIPGYFYIPKQRFTDLSFSRGYELIEVCLESDIFEEKTRLNAIKTLEVFLSKNDFFEKESLFLNKYKYHGNEFRSTMNPFLKNRLNHIKDSSTYFGKSKVKNKLIQLFQNIPISRVQLMKDNSNLIFSVIEAYKHTHRKFFKDVVKRWIYEGVFEKMYDENGFVYSFWEEKPYGISLSSNFTFMDILMDYYHFIEQDANLLEKTEKIANFWLSKKMLNGLIPESPSENVDFLDCQTDFSVSLKKLSYLTKNNFYEKEGERLFYSIILNHYKEGYLVNRVDSRNRIVDSTVNLKYNALFLKSYIAYHSDLNLFDHLFKDR